MRRFALLGFFGIRKKVHRLFSRRKLRVREVARGHGLHDSRARQADRTGKARRAGACSDADIVIALFQHIGQRRFAEERELCHGEAQMKRLALTRGEHLRLLECIQKPRRTRFAAVRPGTVDLHDLLHGIRFAGILDLDAYRHVAAIQSHAHRAELCLAVAKAVAERVQDATAVGVKVAVAEEAVKLLRGKTERFQRLRPAERELAGRADLAGYDIRERVACLLPGKPQEDDCAAVSCLRR